MSLFAKVIRDLPKPSEMATESLTNPVETPNVPVENPEDIKPEETFTQTAGGTPNILRDRMELSAEQTAALESLSVDTSEMSEEEKAATAAAAAALESLEASNLTVDTDGDGVVDHTAQDATVTPVVEEPGSDEGADDTVIEDDDSVPYDGEDEIGDVEEDVVVFGQMTQELELLGASYETFEQYGASPAAVGIAQKTGLLAGTALESFGLESFANASVDSPETEMALEALGEKIKEKAAAWGAKILSVASKIGGGVMKALTSVWNAVSGAASKLASGTWDLTKAAGRKIKAHPYKTIAAVIGAMVVAAGAVAFAGGHLPMPGSATTAVKSFYEGLASKINAIKWPFGKVSATVSDNGIKLLTDMSPSSSTALVPVAPAKMGWTKSMFASAMSQLNKLWGLVKSGVGAFGARAVKIANGAKVNAKPAAKVAGTVAYVAAATYVGIKASWHYFLGMFSAIGDIIRLIRIIIVGGFRIIASTFRALASLVTGGSKEPAPAAA